MRTTYHVYLDPGHGWLKVPRRELHELSIAHLITPYSYQRGDWVFLEEDGDLSTFARAHPQWDTVKRVEHYTDNRSRIRGYRRYDPDGGAS